MKIATIVDTPAKKLACCYRAQKLAIDWHNEVAPRLTQSELRKFRDVEWKPRIKNILYTRSKYLDQRYTSDADTDAKIALKESAKADKSLDKSLPFLTCIEPIGRDLPVVDPLENYTTYSVVDTGGAFSIAQNKITVTNMTRVVGEYVYRDMGVNHFSGDFEHTSEIARTGTIQGSNMLTPWALGNTVGALATIRNDVGLAAFIYSSRIYIEWSKANSIVQDSWDGVVTNTVYYLTAARDESIGANGTAYCYIYSDASRTNLIDTLSVALTAKADFRYVYGMMGYGTSQTDYPLSGFAQNLDLGEGSAIPVFVHHRKMMNGGV